MSMPDNPLFDFVERLGCGANAECAICQTVRWTYEDLLRNLSKDRETLADLGIACGDVVVLHGGFTLRHISLFLALALASATAVPLLVRDEEIHRYCEIVNATRIAKADPDGKWVVVKTGSKIVNPVLLRFLKRNEPGLIVFTSGSLGERKAILHSLQKLLRKFSKPRNAYRTLAFLQIDHLGGINTILHTLANRELLVFPRSHSVAEVCALVQKHRVQLLPTTPSFLNLLLASGAYSRYDLSSLELITYGTEVMPKRTLERLREIFPAIRLQQTYGLSELGVLRSKSRDSGSLAVRIGGEGYETKVQGGTLWIRSDFAMEGYLNYPNPFSEDGWFDTGDLVEADGDFLTFRGRKSNTINVGGEKVFPVEIENVLLSLPAVHDALVCARPNSLMGSVPVAYVVLGGREGGEATIRQIRDECEKQLPRFMVPAEFHVVNHLEYSNQYKKLRTR
jgi:long-chain acyl-CoA synthetase